MHKITDVKSVAAQPFETMPKGRTGKDTDRNQMMRLMLRRNIMSTTTPKSPHPCVRERHGNTA